MRAILGNTVAKFHEFDDRALCRLRRRNLPRAAPIRACWRRRTAMTRSPAGAGAGAGVRPPQGMGAWRAVLDPAAEPSQCGLENPCLTLLGQHQRRGIGARTLAPTPGKELEPLPCAARPELNTIAERTNIFAGARFDFVKSGRAFRLTFARARSMITIHRSRCRQKGPVRESGGCIPRVTTVL
jgi:hypothetical protein